MGTAKLIRWSFSIMATDTAGNIAIAQTTVTVPHDPGKKEANNGVLGED